MGSQDTWALVTGACSGIGLEIARELARRGYSQVLVSDRGPELVEAADRMASEHHVETRPLVMNLALPEAASELHRQVRRLGLDIDILVSNAGFLLFGEMADVDPARANAMLQLHVVTPSLLAHHFGSEMRARRHGYILLVSSAASWTDFPGIALYGSSKRYLRSFAASLREELRPYGVKVTCLAPGAVATGLYDCGGGAAAAARRARFLRAPDAVAKDAVRGMFKGQSLVLPGVSAKLMAAASAVTPRWLVRLVRAHTDLLPRPGR
jgi:short-subunit dehydrogenase